MTSSSPSSYGGSPSHAQPQASIWVGGDGLGSGQQQSPPTPPPPEAFVPGLDEPLGPMSHKHRAADGTVYTYETLQDRLLNVGLKWIGGILKNSHTVARIDLVRPRHSLRVQQDRYRRDEGSAFGRSSEPVWSAFDSSSEQGGRRRRRRRKRANEWLEREEGGIVEGMDHLFYGEGARLKLMQVWDFEDPITGRPRLPWGTNFGVGMNFDVDEGRLEPKLRMKASHATLHLLPEPAVEMRGRWPLGFTNMDVDIRYRVPVASLGRFWDRSEGAALTINLFNRRGTGMHLSPGGLEFDEQVVRIGQHTKIRVAATLGFPSELPLEEGEQPIRIRVNRLALRTRLI